MVPFVLRVLLLLTALGGGQLVAQQVEPTPYTALIDFTLYRHPARHLLAKPGLPIWLDRVDVLTTEAGDALPARTTIRIRVRQLPSFQQAILLRLFFDDQPEARPVVSAWSETGTRRLPPTRLGAGLGLPASDSVAIPTAGVDLIEIDVDGDGSNIRQALLATLRFDPVATAFDFARARPVADPFGATPTREEAQTLEDTLLFGRVRAVLDPGPIHLNPAAALPESDTPGNLVTFSFSLEAEPLLGLLEFEVLNADPTTPLQMWINDTAIGIVSLALPDLADPGYKGEMRPLRKMRFHYAGWVSGQKIMAAGLLRAGQNTITLQLPTDGSPIALRNIQLQLKNHWQKLDYILVP